MPVTLSKLLYNLALFDSPCNEWYVTFFKNSVHSFIQFYNLLYPKAFEQLIDIYNIQVKIVEKGKPSKALEFIPGSEEFSLFLLPVIGTVHLPLES